MTKAIIYARVSSKDQEKEGFSIPAQLDLLRQHATAGRTQVLQEFIDVETAKQAGRAAFGEMVAFIRKYRGRLIILVEKTDRLYRNLRDWVTLDELGVEIHLVKENVVLSPDSRSHEKFMHGIKVLMAKNYIDNLSEETRKGMTEKARQGIWPSFAPIGYRNVLRSDGKRTIEPDPEVALIVSRLFKRFAVGDLSIKALARDMRSATKSVRGQTLYSSLVHQILRKRIYTGDFDFDGVTYTGTHQPLVSRETWDRVQSLLDYRAQTNTRKVKHEFPLTGLVHCGHCGCLLVGELKKQRYVYYHCTGNRGRCDEPYVRQEKLTGNIAQSLGQLVIAPATLAWLERTAAEMDQSEQTSAEQTTRRLRADYDRLQGRIDMMYMDRLDGRITAEFFDARSAEWRREQNVLQSRMEQLKSAALRSAAEAVQSMRSVSQACAEFQEQPQAQQRSLASTILKRAMWQNGELRTVLVNSYEVLRHSNSVSRSKEMLKIGSGQEIDIWLPKKSLFKLPLHKFL